MKEETFKEYEWRGKDLEKLLKSVGVEGDILTIYSDAGMHTRELYLHVKTKTDTVEK